MSGFGKLLRSFRKRCNDPFDPEQRLSQERLGELLGIELGRDAFSGAAVSDWERGVTKIHADQRKLLISLIEVLHKQGGLKTPSEANELLEAGDYRALNPAERRQVFPEEPLDLPVEPPPSKPQDRQRLISFFLERAFFESKEELETLLTEAEEGPPPTWPRIVAALLRRALDRWSIWHAVRTVLWLWVWLLAWALIAPSLRWPFASQENAKLAIWIYVGGTLVIPLLIGILTDPKNNKFWQQQNLATTRELRLYTYQGAAIGFHLGYFAVFFISLLSYHIRLYPTAWVELTAAVFPLIVGYMGARLVPYNLWHAYGRLDLADGGVFFIFLILGPLWGLFIYNFYPSLLTPNVGLTIILAAVTILVGLMAWQQRLTGLTIIPAHWWVILYGSILVLYQISTAKDLYSVVSLAGLVLVLSTLLALGRIRFTWIGALGFLVALGLLLVVSMVNIWVGRALAVMLLLAWWRWGKRLLSFPPSFWIIVLVGVGSSWGVQHRWWSDIWASITFGAITLLVLWWERRYQQ